MYIIATVWMFMFTLVQVCCPCTCPIKLILIHLGFFLITHWGNASIHTGPWPCQTKAIVGPVHGIHFTSLIYQVYLNNFFSEYTDLNYNNSFDSALSYSIKVYTYHLDIYFSPVVLQCQMIMHFASNLKTTFTNIFTVNWKDLSNTRGRVTRRIVNWIP